MNSATTSQRDRQVGHLERDASLHSIYEKYLHEGRDTPASDARVRAERERRIAEANARENMELQNTKHTHAKAGQSISFAHGTKRTDGGEAADGAARSSTGSAYDGFAQMMDDYSESEDSADEGVTKPTSSRSQGYNNASAQRDSWGARAIAVGQRPPDSRSQNPPTLKLLGLKSQREGGAPIGRGTGPSPRQANFPLSPSAPSPIRPEATDSKYEVPVSRAYPPQRRGSHEQSISDYGDNSSRVGSTIDFRGTAAGHGSDGFGGRFGHVSAIPSMEPVPQSPESQVQDRANDLQASRRALTAQLGLNTPTPTPRSLPTDGQRPTEASRDYFSGAGQGVPLERTTTGSSGSQSSQGHPRVPDNAIVRIVSNSSGPPSPPVDPFGGGPPGRALLPTPNKSSPPRAVLPTGARTAHDIRAGAPQSMQHTNRAPPPKPLMMEDSYQKSSKNRRAAPAPVGFSDSAGPQQKRQSIFRRSLALVSGSGGQGAPSQRPTQGGYTGQNQNKRQSALRRSWNLLGGNKNLAPPTPAELQVSSPAPTVRTFEKADLEKPKTSYMGGSSDDEWDPLGQGAPFWARFNMARAHADTGDKMEQTSRSYRARVYYQQRASRWLAGLGGFIIIAGVIGIIVWREMATSSSDSNPGAVQKGDYSGTTSAERRRSAFQTAAADIAGYQRSDNDDLWAAAAVRRGPEAAQPTSTSSLNMPREEVATRLRKVRRHGQMRQAIELA